jgi:hypothetical protein
MIFMVKINSMLTERLKQATEKFSKMTSLAELSSSGQLSSFSGVFRVSSLSEKEQENLRTILREFNEEEEESEKDFQALSSISSEVKAINNQAAILHGERIKRAQDILKRYKEGAFSAWLIAAYGNRQTPYNFLQYYELYTSLPHLLHSKLDEMPRQAVYTLASRAGSLSKKEEIIKNYQGEPKSELISLIRKTFPLPTDDHRAQDFGTFAINALGRLYRQLNHDQFKPTPKQKKAIHELLHSLARLIDG